MNFKRISMILAVFLILILGICVVSASENTADMLNIEENESTLEVNEEPILEQINNDPALEIKNQESTLKSNDNASNTKNNKKDVEITPETSFLAHNSPNSYEVNVFSNAKSLKGILVTVKAYTGNSYQTFQAKTDKNGYAYFPLSVLSIGKHKLNITVDTNQYYKSIQSTLTIKQTQLYISGITNFLKGTNKKLKLKAYFINHDSKTVPVKNFKLKIKFKLGKKTKTYTVRTNSKGHVTLFNVKNLKPSHYKFTTTGKNNEFYINEKNYLSIFKPAKKTITLKMGKNKKINAKDGIETFYTTDSYIYTKGVYASSYNIKSPLDKLPNIWVVKAKFFFKNKKTGKIITKTTKAKWNKEFDYQQEPYHKLISGYKPIKTKIWYVSI